MPGFLSPRKGVPLLLIPEYSGINKGQRVPDRSKTAHRKPLVKCFLTVFDFPLLWLAFLQQVGLLCIYSCGEGLLSPPPLISFTLKGVRKFYCGNWFLETLLYLEFISATPALGDFLRASVINKNPRPCEFEVLVSLFGQAIVAGNVYRHFLKFISGSWESQHPGLWIRVNYTWANT